MDGTSHLLFTVGYVFCCTVRSPNYLSLAQDPGWLPVLCRYWRFGSFLSSSDGCSTLLSRCGVVWLPSSRKFCRLHLKGMFGIPISCRRSHRCDILWYSAGGSCSIWRTRMRTLSGHRSTYLRLFVWNLFISSVAFATQPWVEQFLRTLVSSRYWYECGEMRYGIEDFFSVLV